MTTLLVDQMTVRRDGERITVHIPMALKVRGGRKEVILPEELVTEHSPARKPATQESLVIAIARAHRWKMLLESGKYRSIGDLARAINMDNSYVARLLNLTLLAPDIVMAILDGREPSGLSLSLLMKNIPLDWVEQRERFGFTENT